MLKGCYTALMTPFTDNYDVDYDALNKLIAFQIAGGGKWYSGCGNHGREPNSDLGRTQQGH